jgi:hypothetical protein
MNFRMREYVGVCVAFFGRERVSAMASITYADMCGGRDSDRRRWGELDRDLLTLIFLRVPDYDISRSVRLVCKSWLAVVEDPFFKIMIVMDIVEKLRVEYNDI